MRLRAMMTMKGVMEGKRKTGESRKKTVSEEGGTLDQSGASTYGYVFVWKRRREKKKKEGGSGRAGV